MRIPSLFLVFLFQLSACYAQTQSGKSAPFDASQEAVTIEEISTSVRFENEGTSQRTTRERVKIQNEAGLKQYGIITFTFAATDDFKIDTVEVHKKSGPIVKAGPENIQDATPQVSRVAPMYSDLHQKEVTVPGLAVGDEVIFQSTSKENSLVPGQFWFRHSFRKNAVVLAETVELNVPKDRKLHIKYQPGYKPVIQENGNRRTYTWHAVNESIPAPKKLAITEKLWEAGNRPPPSIEVSTIGSWEEIGEWYNNLQKDRVVPGPAIKAKALELTKDLASPEEKAKALYEYVSSNFRYISIDFGIGRYQPHAADQVLSNGYGDCKDKHTLLAALLQAAGIEAFPALISSTRNVDPEVPSPAQFDHVITAVAMGKDYVFLDTTAEVAPYGMLLLSLRHKRALVVPTHAAAKFVETPLDPPFPVRETFELNGKVDESGTMEAEVSHFARGDSEVLVKDVFRRVPPSKYKDIAQALSYSSGFGGEVSVVKLTGMQDVKGGFGWDYHYHRPDYFDMNDRVPKNSLPLSYLALREMDETEENLRLYFSPGELLFKCKIQLPEGFTAQAPLPIKLERDYARYESTYSIDKNTITAEKRLVVLVPEVIAAHRQDYAAFRRAILQDEAQSVVLRPPAGFVAKSTGKSKIDLDELMRQGEIELREKNYEAAYTTFQKVADRDPKRKNVWSLMGSVEMALGRREQAVRDFKKQVETDPFDAEAHSQLGYAYLAMGRKDQVVAELNKAAEIDPLAHRTHYLLGFYYSQEKDYSKATPELEKALATEDPKYNDESQVRGLLTEAYFKLKQQEKAAELLNRSVEASPNPQTWNNAAYALADNDFHLEKAKEYADLAIKALSEELQDLHENSITRTDFGKITALVHTWDTLGWIHFRSGNLAAAEKYVRAAWLMDQSPAVCEHLGEIYEKLGRTQEAIRYYAMCGRSILSSNASLTTPRDLARERLEKLAGKERAQTLITTYAGKSSNERTVNIGKAGAAGARAQVLLVFGPGPKLEAVHVMSGDSELREGVLRSAQAILKLVAFPDDRPAKLAREALVVCNKYTAGCNLVVNTSPSF